MLVKSCEEIIAWLEYGPNQKPKVQVTVYNTEIQTVGFVRTVKILHCNTYLIGLYQGHSKQECKKSCKGLGLFYLQRRRHFVP